MFRRSCRKLSFLLCTHAQVDSLQLSVYLLLKVWCVHTSGLVEGGQRSWVRSPQLPSDVEHMVVDMSQV